MVKGVGTLTGYFTICCFFLELQQKTFFNVVNFPNHLIIMSSSLS